MDISGLIIEYLEDYRVELLEEARKATCSGSYAPRRQPQLLGWVFRRFMSAYKKFGKVWYYRL